MDGMDGMDGMGGMPVVACKGEYLGATIRTQKAETTAALDRTFGVLPPRDGQTEAPRQFHWDQAQQDNVDMVDDGLLGAQEASKVHRGTKILVSEESRNRAKVAEVLRDQCLPSKNGIRSFVTPKT